MEKNQFSEELAKYVSFSLRVKPKITFEGYYDDKGEFIKKKESVLLEDPDSLSEKDLVTVEALMDKYKSLKKYLPPNSTLNNLKISSDTEIPLEGQRVNSDYTVVRISSKQLEIAKKVSIKAEEIYNLYKKEEFRMAKKSYTQLQNFLAKERNDLIGEFKSSREVEDALEFYAVGANNDSMNHPTFGEGCFVLIEIFLI